MPLTAIQVKNAKPKEKQYKLTDGEGMYLLVLPAGGKYWRLKYRYSGKEKLLALGVYPAISLAEARERRADAKRLLSKGEDPTTVKKIAKITQNQNSSDNFKSIAREWHDKQKAKLAEVTARDTLSKLINHVFPHIGTRPIGEITAPEVLALLRRLESAGKVSAAHRTKQIISRVFRYAVATGRATHDPAADLKGALAPEVTRHHASITDPKQIGELLRTIDTFTGTFQVKCALQLAPMLFVRPGELRTAEWEEFDLKKGEWVIPAEKTKLKREHLVPLSTQAVVALKELYRLTGNQDRIANGRKRYLFSTTQKPMSENTINKALKSLGYSSKQIVGHGFRTMASTLLHEQGWLSDAIERQMAHVEKNEVKGTYNKALHIDVRVQFMQAWSDYLDGLKEDKEGRVVQLKRA
ncbi:MAG: integrase [Acidiferrobacteraceae bacterium]|jgi:integrase|nr:integrase [Acidiferrobacteraceae bacterium]MDP6672183.1 tyrosine-type recombinase/integrase [Arenicellales bacterium]MDP6725375.1 tyrosine-type recombinase/integrase [Arenicellales bacterium]|tara:strand:+ start:208 stop:1440 length:1233 start_codon:yes stop_codon:yes gene_type:complete